MLHNLLGSAASVLLWILEQFTELAVCKALPDHRRRGRREVPIGRARRHVQASQVVVLVTGATFDRIDTLPIGSAPDLHGVAMAIVSLARIVSDGVAIHAARVMQDGHKGFEGGRRSRIVTLRYCADALCLGTFNLLSSRPHDQ